MVAAAAPSSCKERAVVEAAEPESSGSESERAGEREQMVATQLAARGIRDERVLTVMRSVPRHVFVPPEYRDLAYGDRPLPIGYDQTISQPFVVAFMTERLGLTGTERVLEVGTGSGYQTAILAELAREVWSIEIVAPLADRARVLLGALGHANVHVLAGDGYEGWPTAAPFDAILVGAAPDHVPLPLLDQLANGGRMILPVGDDRQDLLFVRRTPEGFVQEQVLPVRFVPMTGIAEQEGR